MKLVTRPSLLKAFLTSFFFLFLATSAWSSGVDRKDCFPIETLPTDTKKRAEELLLKALDSEALYSIVGGIKPMSSGFATFRFDVREPADESKRKERSDSLSSIDEARAIFAKWRCGENIYAEMQHFSRAFEGKRSVEAVVFDSMALRKMLNQRSHFFSRWGITQHSHPLTVLYAVETAEATPRFAGYGYLFGYPEHAVEFFVNAANKEELTGRFVERSFYSIDTFASKANRFVFAVPKGQEERTEDAELKKRAESVLAEYKARRARFIGEGKPGVAELLRDWFCEKGGKCDPASVRY
jgi:hypothetical protein